MKIEEANYLRCPSCRGQLILNIRKKTTVEVREGSLTCTRCHKKYSIHKGIPNLLITEDKRTLEEKAGWLKRAKNADWYHVTDDYLNSLPYPAKSNEDVNWKIHADSFYHMLKKLDLKGKRVLDVGVGKPWTTRDLALCGAHAVALELFDDDKIGLGVADVYMKKNKIYFGRIVADMNNIPYQDGAFDIIFYQGALHHSVNLWQSMTEANRMLRKGGVIIFGREGSGGILSREWVGPCPDGVNEHNYKNARYLLNLVRLGHSFKIYNEPHKPQTGLIALLWKMWTLLRGGPLLLIATKKC